MFHQRRWFFDENFNQFPASLEPNLPAHVVKDDHLASVLVPIPLHMDGIQDSSAKYAK